MYSRFCNRSPKYLKCADSHLYRDCKKTLKTPAKCALCGGPHPINFSGCSKNPINAKPVKAPTVNVWEERKKQQQTKMALQTLRTAQQITIQHNTTTNPALVDTVSQFQSQLTNLK
ncbi:nucleic-acid-binding protein from transposon X-element [Nephila pilipes]|uniref:Nucleic-acid-binding protein from transposon X-element n=1 Tax=Nephila pilipes TaxID=299642 RepID=A0A8X6UIX5_NEPPI|nr:nucleic-acid-binding protein from transposon X-element [Nephila pilipes]